MTVPRITDSSARIAGIYYITEGAGGFTAGSLDCHMGCDKIVAYDEKGVGDFMPFYAGLSEFRGWNSPERTLPQIMLKG